MNLFPEKLLEKIEIMQNNIYNPLIRLLKETFGNRLKTVVLFGSRARGKVKENRDHDIFLVIENLPENPIKRQQEVRSSILSREAPIRVNTIVKTPEEIDANLTPLLLEICVDGICLSGKSYFEPYRRRALRALKQAGLQRKYIGREWYWQFEKVPHKQWELTWEGFREF